MKHSVAPPKASLFASYLIAAILCLLPFHALLTTWAASNFGHFDLFRIIKELLMIPLGVYAALLLLQQKELHVQLKKNWLAWLIGAYTLLFVGLGLLGLLQDSVNHTAIAYSLITNLRFLWFMAIVWIISSTHPFLGRHWQKIVLIPASLVVGFGALQRFILPIDFLRHFGYGPDTIEAVQTVDQKLDFRRIQSTLRGANPLGAYLIIVLTTAAYYVKRHAYLWVLIVGSLAVLFFSYSRSAWIGLAFSILVLVWLSLRSQRLKSLLLLLVLVGSLLFTGVAWVLRNNDTTQNVLFHSDETSQSSISSNEQRLGALETSLKEIWNEPFGRGPGTAGPASFHNNNQPRIAENYFLQIGQEIGWIGIGLFVSINLLVAQALWRKSTPLSRILLASLVGITVVNLISHAWADDTLSLLWWGLAGIALSLPGILKKS